MEPTVSPFRKLPFEFLFCTGETMSQIMPQFEVTRQRNIEDDEKDRQRIEKSKSTLNAFI
jgi:hypothetical protein